MNNGASDSSYPSSSSSSSFSSPFPHWNRRLPEDTVFYSIYPDLSPNSSPSEIFSSLRSLHLHIFNSILSPFLSNYIWQHDPFLLSLNASPPTPHLHGRIRFGDNIDDEWFVVFILYQISCAIPSVSIKVHDSDGEFLLIESAFSLPRWINPDNSHNRVFIRNGELHVIPKKDFPTYPTLDSALNVLRSGKIQTRASDSVQSVINKRISAYPERAKSNMHRVRVRVPLPVAQVLKHEPCLISLAVEGFYDRDIDSMKDASRMEKFLRTGGGGEVEMVLVSVRMSRAMYGQLVQQKFEAPKFYPMPLRREVGSVVYYEAELGMKIAFGFEMMYQERKRAGDEGKGGTWDAFVKSLESSGCFEGLLPGSIEYKRIMDGALEYYRSSALFSRTRDIMNAPLRRIDEILALAYSSSDFNLSEVSPSDDDSWLYNGEDELNSAISDREKEMEVYESEHRKNQKSREQKVTGNKFSAQSDDFNLKDVAETMQAFVQKVSSFEGVEVPQNRRWQQLLPPSVGTSSERGLHLESSIFLNTAKIDRRTLWNSNAVELDVGRFIKDMESVAGPAWHEETVHDADSEEGSTPSSEMDFDESEDGSDIADPFGGDDTGDTFMQSYSDALNEELNATTLKRSFIRAHQQPSNDDEGTSNASKDMGEELTPVDVDVNLVKSFLDSFSSQEGLPGPASNLLGLMGLKVPHGKNNK